MNRPWPEIAQSFRDVVQITMPKEHFIALLLILVGIGIGAWVTGRVLLRQFRKRKFYAGLSRFNLSAKEHDLLLKYIAEKFPHRPAGALESLSMYNLWVDEQFRGLWESHGVDYQPRGLAEQTNSLRQKLYGSRNPEIPLSSSRDIRVNEFLTLIMDVGPTRTFHKAVVTEIDDLGIRLNLLSKERTPRVSRGDAIEVSLAHLEAMYVFKAQILQTAMESVFTLVITHATQFRIVQHREYFRQQVSISVYFQYVEHDEGGNAHTGRGNGQIVNLSGGGCSLRADFTARVNGNFHFNLLVEDVSIENLTAQVRRIDRPKDAVAGIYHCEFLGMEEVDREGLIRYLFRKQLEI